MLAQYAYTTDPARNITGIADAINAGYSRTFGYDDLHRLITANTGASFENGTGYQYDTDDLLIGAGALALTRNPQNGLLTGTALGASRDTYTYNEFGEVARYVATRARPTSWPSTTAGAGQAASRARPKPPEQWPIRP